MSDPRVESAVYQILKDRPEGITRDELVGRVRGRLGDARKDSTLARRVREARDHLVRRGVPVISDGKGFRIATGPEEILFAARRFRRTADDLYAEALRLEGMARSWAPGQPLLFGGEDGTGT